MFSYIWHKTLTSTLQGSLQILQRGSGGGGGVTIVTWEKKEQGKRPIEA